MNSPKWTPAQQAAIDLKGQILVAAAAGSGKTAVLVQRLFQRITDLEEKVDVDRFLVVTFTKAAAAEMRERIGKALEEALFAKTDQAQIEHLLRQRALLYKASITTLHSFCMELIRQYFYQLELDPSFRVADEAEAGLLLQDTLEELFEAYYSQEDPAFLALVEAFGTDRDDQPLMDGILRLYEFSRSQVQPEAWLNKLSQAYAWESLDSLIKSPWGKVVLQGIKDKAEESCAYLERAKYLAQLPGGPFHYLDVLEADLARLSRLQEALREESWTAIQAAFAEAADFPALPRGGRRQNKSTVDEEEGKRLREESKKARDEAKKKLEEIKKNLFAVPWPEQLPYLREVEKLVQTLSQVTRQFAQNYQVAKRQRNIVDFADLEHYALQLLEKDNRPTEIALRLKEFYAEVLVDEYQDINPVQERILQLVSRQEQHPNLFMVGDVKQSIYRFRMADPGLFLHKYAVFPHYPAEGKDSQAKAYSPGLVIDLNQNFRSRGEVIEGINYLCYQIMTEGAGEIAYDEQAALRPGAKFPVNSEYKTGEGPIEVHLFDPKIIELAQSAAGSDEMSLEDEELSGIEGEKERTTDGEGEDSLEDAENARIEARLMAARIQEMVLGCEFCLFDKELEDFRPVQYSDIVVLMRSLSTVANIYTEEFQKAGIPVYAESNSGYFGTNEVDTILSLLKIIDNPRQDIPLGAVLRSPLVDMNGTELGKLRSILPKGDFYETMVLAFWAGHELKPEELETTYADVKEVLDKHKDHLSIIESKAKNVLTTAPEIASKLKSFYPRLLTWRELARRSSLADLLWQIYEETGYLAYVGTLPAGAQRQANLRILYDRACRYEATNYRGLFRFLRFLEKFRDQGKDLGTATIMGEKENVVRFITVHSSKGLEFPVVFLAGLGRKFNTRSLSEQMLLHSQLGLGVPLIDLDNQVRYPSLIQYAVKERLWQEALAEELRILYVALTRAKERLLLYGHYNNLTNTINKWLSFSQSCPEVAFPDGQLRSAKCYLDWLGPALARHPQDLFATGLTWDFGLPASSSQWQVFIHDRVPLVAVPLSKVQEPKDREAENEGRSKGETATADPLGHPCAREGETLYTELDKRLSWQYPYLEAVNQGAKTSVSELKRQLSWYLDPLAEPLEPLAPAESPVEPLSQHGESQYLRPKFLQIQKELTPAEKGTAVHTAIQHLPLAAWKDTWEADQGQREEMLKEYLADLIRKEILSEEQGKAVSPVVLRKLLESTTGKRLFQGKEVWREVPFTLSLKLKGQPEPVLVQGIIDAVIFSSEDEGAQIVDFKTDNLLGVPEPQKELTKRYALQLGLYTLAVERLLKVPVQECLIYSTSLDREFVIRKEEMQAALNATISI